MSGTLIYLSNCAISADGRQNPFMMQELPWLMSHFDRVMMVSYYGVRTMMPGDERGERPFTAVRPGLAGLRALLKTPFTADVWRELKHMRRDGALTPGNVLRLLAFAQRGLKMHYWTERLMHGAVETHTTLYSCWMSFDGYAAALSKRKHPRVRCVVRGHAYDVDTERFAKNPYMMKRLYLISRTARAQFMSYMRGHVDERKVHVLAMGSAGMPVDRLREPPLYTQGVLRVVSCAMFNPIKQVDVLVRALSRWQGGPLCWTHVGAGAEEAKVRTLASELLDPKENVICELLGELDGAHVQRLYDMRPFDVFINTSKKEGVPVSIMEAMRHGIPVIAPRVGGIPELVTPDVGFLYAPEKGEKGVLEALNRFAALPREEAEAIIDRLPSMPVQSLRERNFTQLAAHYQQLRWDEGYCSASLLPKLFPRQA